MDKDDSLMADADAALELYRGLLREMVGELAETTAELLSCRRSRQRRRRLLQQVGASCSA